MRVATWNVNSLNARVSRVEEWIGYAQPDVLCLQETKCTEDAFPYMTFQALGYEAAHYGAGRWNGVAIVSKVGLKDVEKGFNDEIEEDEIECRAIWATCGDIRIANLYVPNGRSLDDPHYQYKLQWLGRLAEILQLRYKPEDRLLVCGDFNVAPADIDVYDPKKFVGSTHVSDPERAALQRLLDWGLDDVMRLRYSDQKIFSYWDYRAGDFHMGRGMRIDLILTTRSLADRIKYGLVDRNARKGQQPSDHAPVFVDIADD